VWSTALRNLTNAPPEIKSRAWNAGVVQVLVAAMRGYLQNVHVQGEACAALRIMLMNRSQEDKLVAWKAGVIEVVVAAARGYVDNEPIQARACGVLDSVVNDDTERARAGAAGAVEVVVEASLQHAGSVDVQLLAYSGLAKMIYGSAANQTRAVEAGILDAAVAAMRAHPGNATVQLRVRLLNRDPGNIRPSTIP